MRGGIPISARLFALAAAVGLTSSGDSIPAPVLQAQRAINNRQRFHSAGTEQKKRRKRNRAVLGGRRR